MKHGNRILALILALVFVLAALAGCAGKEDPSTATEPKGSDAPSDSNKPSEDVSVDTIQFAALYPLTGASATTGNNMANGIRLAVDIINDEYDIDLPGAKTSGITSMGGAKLDVVFGDTQADPQKGMSAAEQVLTDN